MISLGIGLIAASIVALTIDSDGLALVILQRRALAAPPLVERHQPSDGQQWPR
jgi:hypothetical protein